MKIENLKTIDCPQIEQLAKLGYWEWHPKKKQLLLSENLTKLFTFPESDLPFPLAIIKHLKNKGQIETGLQVLKYLKAIKNKDFNTNHNFSIQEQDFSVKHFECNADYSSKKNVISGVVQDISETVKYNLLKEKEIRFEKKLLEIASRFLEHKNFKEDIVRTLSDIGLLLNSSQVKMVSIANNKLNELYYWKKESVKIAKNSIIDLLSPSETKYFIELLKEKKVICFNNFNDVPDALPKVKQFLNKSNYTSIILSAITTNNQTIGAFVVLKQNKIKWDFSDIHIVKMTSVVMANALKQNKIQRQLETSENRLQFALLAGNLGTWEYSIEHKKFYYDEKYANMFGYSNNSINRIPNWIYKNIHSKQIPKYIEVLKQCIQGNKKFYSLELKIKCLDGEYKWVHDWGIVTKINDHGEPLTIVGVIQDITKQKQLNDQLLDAKLKAENNEKLKTAFLANVSHEIRTPMNGITGFAELLYNNQVAEKDKQKYFEVIWKNSTRLLQLINNILDISRLESDQIVIYEREYNLNTIIGNIERSTRQNNSKNTKISFDFSGEFDDQMAYMSIDESRLQQVLMNIIDNAIKFTCEGVITINYKLNNNGFVEFCITDTGNGIDKNQFGNIFKRFIKTENSIKLNKGGSGLGLPITKGLVDLMGGDIWFISEKNIGSKFYFTIPYKPTRIKVQNID